MARLNQTLLDTLQDVEKPSYRRDVLNTGIVHIGVGAFHRAHQAVFTDDVLNTSGGDWGIIGASLRSPTAEQQLVPQDGLYTVSTLSPGSAQRRIIGAITTVISACEISGYNKLLTALADPTIHVATVTVTEKGYCETDHADVLHDLQSARLKRSLPGVLAAGLEVRRRNSGAPITVLSCDNLSANGTTLHRVVTEYASLAYPELAAWMDANVSFPNSMVDRIVPSTRDEDRSQFAEQMGFADEGMVQCEPFKQWVIEDRFSGPRPPWEDVGALIVDNVAPFEHAKLRLLNGPHSACAYLGILAGHNYIHEVMKDDILRDFVQSLVRAEIMPTVDALPNVDLPAYSSTIFERFANDAIAYGTRQVGTDGSQKLPQRLIPVVQARLRHGQPANQLAVVFAAWLAHLKEPAPDPLAEQLTQLYLTFDEPEALVREVGRVVPAFGDLGESFASSVSRALTSIRSNGLRSAIANAHHQSA